MESNKSTALMSIVVPVFNRAHLVGATLASLEAQTARPIEVILVDNASSDGSLDVLSRWAEATRTPGFDVTVATCTTPGASAARNEGLRHASAPWIMFFDSDDLMGPGHVARAIKATKDYPAADIIGWDVPYTDGISTSIQRFYDTDMQWNSLFHGSMASARWCARTELVRNAGGWNEHVGYWDDIELGARMLARKPVVRYIGVADISVNIHPASITSTYAADPARIEPALQAIAATTGMTFATDLKRAIEYALTARAGNGRGVELMAKLLRGQTIWHKIWLRWAYAHTRLGLRGAAFIIGLKFKA